MAIDNDKLPDDLQTMTKIILEARGGSAETADASDLIFPLTLLCRFPHPLKRPRYQQEIEKVRTVFEGIAHDDFKQRAFREGLGPGVIEAKSVDDIPFSDFAKCFNFSFAEDERRR